MQLRLSHKHQRGDTIVEVLIAIAVCSSVLGTAYAIVNRTTKTQQQNAEHTAALKWAESQLEALRSAASQPGKLITTSAPPNQQQFCLNASGDHYPNSVCTSVENSRYAVWIYQDQADYSKFTIKTTWAGINGLTDEVDITYRVFGR